MFWGGGLNPVWIMWGLLALENNSKSYQVTLACMAPFQQLECLLAVAVRAIHFLQPNSIPTFPYCFIFKVLAPIELELEVAPLKTSSRTEPSIQSSKHVLRASYEPQYMRVEPRIWSHQL